MAVKTYWMRFGSGDPRTFTGLSPTFLLFYNQAGSAVTSPAITEIAASSGLYTFSWGTTTPIVFLADAATTSPGTSGRYVTGSLDPADTTDWFGATTVALGTTAVALGTTTVAIGTTEIALGTTSVALGITSVSWGLANNTAISNQGTTLSAIGNTSIAYGGTILADILNLGSTLSAIGNTSIAYGGTILADLINQGITLVAIGNTTSAISTSLVVEVAGIGSTASSYGSSSQDPVDLFGYMKRIQENLEGNNTYIKGTGTLNILSRGSATLLISKQVTNSVTTVIKT